MATKKKKTTKEKTTKVKEMSQAHGMVEQEKFQPTSLNQVWGDDGSGKYKTLSLGEYESVLRDMSKSDLQAHAVKIGLIPVDDLRTLKKRLVREFKVHVAQYTRPITGPTQDMTLDQRSRKILEEGR